MNSTQFRKRKLIKKNICFASSLPRGLFSKTNRDYRSISEFFTRQLRPDVRQISDYSCVVSPVDGRVLHFGLATGEQIEQVRPILIESLLFLTLCEQNAKWIFFSYFR